MSGGRKCAWCGAGISHRRGNAKFCGAKCLEKDRALRRYPGRPSSHCRCCGAQMEQQRVGQTRLYCSSVCKEKARSKTKARKDWLNSKEGRDCLSRSKGKYRQSERGKAAEAAYAKKRVEDGRQAASRKKYNHSPRGKEVAREYYRRYAAERALAILLLPTSNPPEE